VLIRLIDLSLLKISIGLIRLEIVAGWSYRHSPEDAEVARSSQELNEHTYEIRFKAAQSERQSGIPRAGAVTVVNPLRISRRILFSERYRPLVRQRPRQHEVRRCGSPMNNLPLAVDLDHGPVGLHVDDLAPAKPPDEPGALEVIKRARWMAPKQARGIPAELGSALGISIRTRCRCFRVYGLERGKMNFAPG